jgi:signal transduction histidine kinase
VPGQFDAVRVGQIVGNLLSNAVKYGAGEPIRVSVRRSGAQAEIAVADQGAGIDEAEQQRIFDRFERGEPPRPGSYGLGLWIVRELLRLHGGSISVRSAPNAGTTFTVTLPLAPPRA